MEDYSPPSEVLIEHAGISEEYITIPCIAIEGEMVCGCFSTQEGVLFLIKSRANKRWTAYNLTSRYNLGKGDIIVILQYDLVSYSKV